MLQLLLAAAAADENKHAGQHVLRAAVCSVAAQFYSQYPDFDTFQVRNIPTQGPRSFAEVLNEGHIRFFIEEWPKNANVTSGEVMEHTPKKTPKKKSKVRGGSPLVHCCCNSHGGCGMWTCDCRV